VACSALMVRLPFGDPLAISYPRECNHVWKAGYPNHNQKHHPPLSSWSRPHRQAGPGWVGGILAPEWDGRQPQWLNLHRSQPPAQIARRQYTQLQLKHDRSLDGDDDSARTYGTPLWPEEQTACLHSRSRPYGLDLLARGTAPVLRGEDKNRSILPTSQKRARYSPDLCCSH